MMILLEKATKTRSKRLQTLLDWYNLAVEENNLWAAKTAMSHYNRIKHAR